MKKQFPVLTLLLTLLLVMTAHAAGTRLAVHLPEGPIEAGEDFTVTVDLTGNPGILNIEFTLSFDRERMECTDMEIGDLLTAQAGASAVNPDAKSGAILAAASANLIQEDGTVGVFHFQAKEKLTDFHFSIDRITLSDQNRKKIDVLVETVNSGNHVDKSNAGNGSGSGQSGNGTAGNGSGSGQSGNGTAGNGSGSGQSGNGTADTNKSGTANNATASATQSQSETTRPLFTDIAGTWAENYIQTAAERNLFQGYPDGTFRPNNRLTRAQFMMVLWNLAGRPTVSEATPFTDMAEQIENFRNAVAWAYAKGYVNGTSPTTFSPGEPLTRQAAVKILFAYHGSKRGTEVIVSSAYDDIFSDSGLISAWAKDAMYWAVYQKILSGTSASTLEPGGTVTRAQLAAIMVRYVERFPS